MKRLLLICAIVIACFTPAEAEIEIIGKAGAPFYEWSTAGTISDHVFDATSSGGGFYTPVGGYPYSFYAPLLSTLVPVKAVDGTPTFTRATTATVWGYAAGAVAGATPVLLTVASGEARFTGARRVSEGVWSEVLADGSAISSSDLKGYLAEGARTNSVFQSRTFNTTWVDSNCAGAAGSCEAKNATGIDGVATTAWTLTDDHASSTTYWASNTITIANDNAVHTCSIHIKKDTDVTRFPAMFCYLGGGTAQSQLCHLNTQTGAVAEENDTGSNDTCTATLTPDGLWWLLQNTATNNTSGNTTLQMFLYGAKGTVIGTQNVAATGSAIFDQAQVELNSTFASSPIVTTTAAVTRNADSLTYPASNYDATKGTALARVSSIWGTATAAGFFALSAGNGSILYRASAASTALRINDSTTGISSTTSTSYQNNPLRVASSWGAVGQSIAYNNTTVVTGAFDGTMGSGPLYVGSYSTGDQWFGNISGVKLWKYKVPDSYLKRITITIPDYLLLEDGGYLLQENGDKIIKETI